MNVVWATLFAYLLGTVIFLTLCVIALWLAVRIMLTAERSYGFGDFLHRLRHFEWETFLPTNLEPVTDLAEVRRIMAEPTRVLAPADAMVPQAVAAEQIHVLEEAGYVIARAHAS